MKKAIPALVAWLLLAVTAHAQVRFDFTDSGMQEALDKAEREGKLVFFDAYTSWCGPCKYMEREILSQPSVGEFINSRFVTIKMNMEKGEGVAAAKKYGVSAYPTYMIITPDGSLQHKVIGGSQTSDDFLGKIGEGLDPSKAAGLLRAKYEQGDRSMDFLTGYINSLVSERNFSEADRVARSLLFSLSDEEKAGEEVWFIYENPSLTTVESPNFDFLIKNKELFYENIGREVVDRKISKTLEEYLVDLLRKNDPSRYQRAAVIAQYIQPYDFQGKEMVELYTTMITAQQVNNTEKMLESLEKLAPLFDDGQIKSIYYHFAFQIRRVSNTEQRLRLVAINDQLSALTDDEQVRNQLERFKKLELGEKMTTGVQR